MISPGPVIAAHGKVATDCFACHKPWRGAAVELCVKCHALPDIGLRTTKGAVIARVSTQPRLKASFHQELIEQDCMACHTDHRSPRLAQQSRKAFSHELLRPGVRQQCESCHEPPADLLHRKIAGDCRACHRQDAWKPATFDHNKHFVLDRDHDAAMRDLPQGQGLQHLHLLRMPRAHASQHPGQARRGRHSGLRELRRVPPECERTRHSAPKWSAQKRRPEARLSPHARYGSGLAPGRTPPCDALGMPKQRGRVGMPPASPQPPGALIWIKRDRVAAPMSSAVMLMSYVNVITPITQRIDFRTPLKEHRL